MPGGKLAGSQGRSGWGCEKARFPHLLTRNCLRGADSLSIPTAHLERGPCPSRGSRDGAGGGKGSDRWLGGWQRGRGSGAGVGRRGHLPAIGLLVGRRGAVSLVLVFSAAARRTFKARSRASGGRGGGPSLPSGQRQTARAGTQLLEAAALTRSRSWPREGLRSDSELTESAGLRAGRGARGCLRPRRGSQPSRGQS